MVPFFPEAKAPIHKLGFWMEEIFDNVLPEERNIDLNEDDYSTDEELVGESYANIDEEGGDVKAPRKKKTSAQKAWDKTNIVHPGGLVEGRQDKTKNSVIGEIKNAVVEKL